MTNPTQDKPVQSSESPKPAPDVPKPAGPISGGNPNISTHHSVDISQSTRLTESTDPKRR